ncbi:MAG: tripartite tricarboxylate transporter TctB family protein [Paracoccaceae bacterium]
MRKTQANHSQPPRRPGELVFNLAMVLGSLFLLYSAYGISEFDALSGSGAVPMATTAVMAICAALILWETVRKSRVTGEKLERDILPLSILVTIVAIVAYALALQPLGFLPTSLLFLWGMIRYLTRRSVVWSALVALGTVAVVYLVFRLIFSVLMPEGIVPEGEIIAWLKRLFAGSGV